MKKIGVIVNPIAGIGGRVGLKGSDGPDTIRLAFEKNAVPEAPQRAVTALEVLAPHLAGIRVIASPGEMGAEACVKAGLKPVVVGSIHDGPTTVRDTEEAAGIMLAEKVDLLMFAGGDGTARDICRIVGHHIPVIGVPAGVKIHSGVFAVTPRNAGRAAMDFITRNSMQCREAEVMDIDEEAFRAGVVTSKLYGSMFVPGGDTRLQGIKMGSVISESEGLVDIARKIADIMVDPETAFIIGPGTTTRAIMENMGLEHTLLGVDVVRNGQVIAKDADERRILDLTKHGPVKIIVTVIGGQGHFFGRGNQQISPRVIKAAGKENILVVATQEKLLGLEGRPLLADTGDEDLDRDLEGYLRVITGYGTYTMYKVGL